MCKKTQEDYIQEDKQFCEDCGLDPDDHWQIQDTFQYITMLEKQAVKYGYRLTISTSGKKSYSIGAKTYRHPQNTRPIEIIFDYSNIVRGAKCVARYIAKNWKPINLNNR